VCNVNALEHPNLPAYSVEFCDVFSHVFIHIEGVDHRVDFERHFVLPAPVTDLEEVVQVALPALGSAKSLVGVPVKAVTGNGQNVLVFAKESFGDKTDIISRRMLF
jgi:hypothetical protein